MGTRLDPALVGAVLEQVRQARDIVLTTHEGPDADGIGSEIALARALRRRGHRVRIVNPGPTARRFAFLDIAQEVLVFKPALERVVRAADLVLLVDTAEVRRTGPMAEVLARRRGPILALDHHPANTHTIPGITVDGFSSTGELLFEVLDHLGVEWTPDLASPLYAAILFDTNQFRFVRNDAGVFRTAARLVEAGADAEAISRALFATVRRDRLLLQARVLEAARFECGGRLAWSVVTPTTMSGLDVDSDDVRTMVMVLGEIEGVDIAVLFKQFRENHGTPQASTLDARAPKVKVSIRSPGNIPIADIAEALGGGGHPFAAGADVHAPLEEAIARALPPLRERLEGRLPTP